MFRVSGLRHIARLLFVGHGRLRSAVWPGTYEDRTMFDTEVFHTVVCLSDHPLAPAVTFIHHPGLDARKMGALA